MTKGMISISPSSTSSYLCSNIPPSPAYGAYISQLIWCARACSTYNHFLIRGSLLTNTLISQGFLQSRSQAAFCKFYGSYNDLVWPSFRPHAAWYVSYQSLSRWHTDLEYGSYRLPDMEIGFMAGMTGPQGMLNPPRHLIPPPIYS
jgi:hypothetical protein